MDKSKQADFVRRMGKKKLSRLKREHFDGGGIAGLLGAAGGQGGTGFNTPSGTNGAQLNNLYNQNQVALGQSQGIANALQPQVTSAVNAQNTLSGQYAQQAQGAGPNVAINELNQATGSNVQNQAALMAGQRGAGANPALLARQTAMQGAQTQQQAAGQAATLQAQQQIQAEQNQANLANNEIAQTQGATNANISANQGEQGILQGANSSNNQIQGQLANQTMIGQQGLIGGILGGAGSALGLAHGGEVHKDKLDFVHKMTKMGLEHHGKPVMMAEGGPTPTPAPSQPAISFGAPASKADVPPVLPGASSAQDSMRKSFGFADGGSIPSNSTQTAQDSMRQAFHFSNGGDIQGHFKNYFAEGGEVPAIVSPGEVYVPPEKVHEVINNDVDPKKIGIMFKGKAKVKGDSKKNDTIPTTLREGGIVVDRDHMGSADKRKLFVHKSIAKKKAGTR